MRTGRESRTDSVRQFQPVSRLASEIQPFIVMEVLERALGLEAAGRSIIHLEVGEPDFATPYEVSSAGIRAIQEGKTHYTHSLGLPRLRQSIAGWQRTQYGVEVDPGRIVVTAGCSAAMVLIFAAVLNPGDRVLLTDPGYPCYPKLIAAFGGVPVPVPVDESSSFQYRCEELAGLLDESTKMVIFNSPSNPTGALASARQIGELVETTRGRAVILSDEIYHGLVYEGRANSILEFTDSAISVNGFSKLFAMTGWRLGYAILPEYLVRPVQKLQQNLFISATDFGQYAAVAALEEAGESAERMRFEYGRRRMLMLRKLTEMGLRAGVEPRGAFYIFVDVRRFTDNVYEFAFEILEKAGVAVTPGVDFGRNGEGYLRLCYANSLENLEAGMDRLAVFFSSCPDRGLTERNVRGPL